MKCSCGYTIKYEKPKNSYNVGDVMKESGFFPILDGVGHTVWICKNCREKVGKLAQQIQNIIKVKWVYIKSLLPKKEKEAGAEE